MERGGVLQEVAAGEAGGFVGGVWVGGWGRVGGAGGGLQEVAAGEAESARLEVHGYWDQGLNQ